MVESRGVDRLARGWSAHAGSRWLARRRSARGMQRWTARARARGLHPTVGHAPLARSVDLLTSLGDGPLGPSPRVMNSI
jgi:hypothetical protein